ncbi:unnamed protein product [Plutella xylostella]|uniref:Dynein axonemal light chain 1 n=1 Tax=Plutella xylostella TaxID=51655 RepID=A0A8S4E595_PLUXY|nr:unnamed protein product [Plutella xylostella]
MSKPMSCKDAIALWEKAHGAAAAEAREVELQFQWPPVEKRSRSSTLVACEKLSLSSNMIDKIAGIAGMKNLKILALGRNNIKSIAGIETVADTLEELWISYNIIDKLKGIGAMKRLRVFYISHNMIKEWAEFNRLQDCPALKDINFTGNPLCEAQADVETWRTLVAARLKQVSKLDGIPIVRDTDFLN